MQMRTDVSWQLLSIYVPDHVQVVRTLGPVSNINYSHGRKQFTECSQYARPMLNSLVKSSHWILMSNL